MKMSWLRESWLRYHLSNYKWFRKLAGGKWEQWWVDVPVCSYIWHDVKHFSHQMKDAADRMGYRAPKDDLTHPYWRGFRPTPLCRGTPTLEDWG